MPLAALVALATASPGATSSFRLPPSPSQRSRAADTPVIDHLPGGGPDGGHILSLAIVATRPSTVFAALRGGGVYASTDLGVTWTPADRGLPPSAWCNLVADPVNTSTLYAACYDGLYKTTDRGTCGASSTSTIHCRRSSRRRTPAWSISCRPAAYFKAATAASGGGRSQPGPPSQGAKSLPSTQAIRRRSIAPASSGSA